jgi:hypothetical protein
LKARAVRVIAFSGAEVTNADLLQMFDRCLARMARLIASREPPLVLRVTRGGEIDEL